VTVDNGDVVTYLAAPGSEWRPDQADWSDEVVSVTTSSTFGIVKAANNEPRFDHTSAGVCRGLLIEEGRTNLFSSTNFNDWSAVRCTKTPITGIGLTNQATTLTISETGSIYIVRGATLTTSVAYAISVRVKAGTIASFSFADITDAKYSRGFNLSTNQWAASGGAPEFTNYTVTPNIDGWFLVSAIYTPTGATGVKNIAFLLGSSTVGQTVSFDTPQIEAGSFPTSYIPTTTGTLARGADVCSITGGNFNTLFNNVEGSVLFIGASAGTAASGIFGTAAFYLDISSSTTDRISFFSSNTSRVEIKRNNIDQYASNRPFFINTELKQSIGYSSSQLSSGFNNNISMTSTANIAFTMPSVNSFQIGRAGTASNYLNGTISAIRYYKKRLPNAKLQALTS
jgi:hypothetical protein